MNGPRPRLRVRVLHLAALSTLAFAQPLFEALVDNALFLSVRQTTPAELWALVAAALILPAAILAALEVAVHRASTRAGWTLHLALVMGLVFVVASPLFASGADWATLAGPGAAALAATFGYARWSVFPLAVTFLTPALVVIPALFAARAPVQPWHGASAPRSADPLAEALPPEAVAKPLPVALLVFDELPLVTLLDEHGRLDRIRHPNFASLADDALWIRNATADASHTRRVVPALLTGRLPDERRGRAPHEGATIFHLLARTHAVAAYEPFLPLCPGTICPRPDPDAPWRRAALLLRDAAIVEAWLLTPRPLRAFLERPIDLMGAFGQAGIARAHGDASASDVWNDPAVLERVVDTWRRDPAGRPTLHFAHVMLPHQPFVFLPSGQRYDDTGNRHYAPVASAAFALDLHRRHAAQAAWADAVLGRFLERLRALPVWDEGIVVVTADHGIGFVAGSNPRNADEQNLGDVAWVPLFVRAPGLRRGVEPDRPTSTVDVLPTILDLLDAPAPAEVDGTSVLSLRPSSPERRIRNQRGGAVTIPASSDPLEAAIVRKLAHVGAGPLENLFRSGAAAAAMLESVDALPRGEPANDVAVSIAGARRFAAVDCGRDHVPAVVSGTVDAPRPIELAIALNGRLAAVPVIAPPRPFESVRRWEAFLPWMLLRSGRNRIELFELDRAGGALRLRALPDRPLERYDRPASSSFGLSGGAFFGSPDSTHCSSTSSVGVAPRD